jgi:hypothetical protein
MEKQRRNGALLGAFYLFLVILQLGLLGGREVLASPNGPLEGKEGGVYWSPSNRDSNIEITNLPDANTIITPNSILNFSYTWKNLIEKSKPQSKFLFMRKLISPSGEVIEEKKYIHVIYFGKQKTIKVNKVFKNQRSVVSGTYTMSISVWQLNRNQDAKLVDTNQIMFKIQGENVTLPATPKPRILESLDTTPATTSTSDTVIIKTKPTTPVLPSVPTSTDTIGIIEKPKVYPQNDPMNPPTTTTSTDTDTIEIRTRP